MLLLRKSLDLLSESGIKPPSSGRAGNRNLAEMIEVQTVIWLFALTDTAGTMRDTVKAP